METLDISSISEAERDSLLSEIDNNIEKILQILTNATTTSMDPNEMLNAAKFVVIQIMRTYGGELKEDNEDQVFLGGGMSMLGVLRRLFIRNEENHAILEAWIKILMNDDRDAVRRMLENKNKFKFETLPPDFFFMYYFGLLAIAYSIATAESLQEHCLTVITEYAFNNSEKYREMILDYPANKIGAATAYEYFMHLFLASQTFVYNIEMGKKGVK